MKTFLEYCDEMSEAFVSGGKKYTFGFGKYYCDGKKISKEEYYAAKPKNDKNSQKPQSSKGKVWTAKELKDKMKKDVSKKNISKMSCNDLLGQPYTLTFESGKLNKLINSYSKKGYKELSDIIKNYDVGAYIEFDSKNLENGDEGYNQLVKIDKNTWKIIDFYNDDLTITNDKLTNWLSDRDTYFDKDDYRPAGIRDITITSTKQMM